MKQCPDCKATLLDSDKACKACGWSVKGASGEPRSFFDGRCSYESIEWGRCCYVGAVSHSTQGGGPWLCMGHFRDGSGIVAEQVCEASVRAAIEGRTDRAGRELFEPDRRPETKPRGKTAAYADDSEVAF